MATNHQRLDDRVRRLEKSVALLRMQVETLQSRLERGGAQADHDQPDGPRASSVDAAVTALDREVLPAHGVPPAAGHPARPLLPRPSVDTAETDAGEPIAPPDGSLSFPAEPVGLERRIGGQLFAIAGALIVVIGLALAAKVAFDAGWFRLVPPGVRCLGIAALGGAFLGAGEFLRTRVRPVAVAGCNAAGLGAMYVASYAAFGVFGLISAPVAFVMMAGVAALGFIVAMRHGFLSTALLSLLGAYLVPILLARPDASPLVLPVYLLLLSVTTLALVSLRPRPFARLRDAVWIGTGVLGFLWTLAESGDTTWVVLAFWVCAWGLHQAELLVSAARGALTQSPEGLPRRLRRRVEPVLLSVATTVGVVGVTAVVLEQETLLSHWLAPASLFVVTSLLALMFGGHLRVLRDKPRSGLETLAAAHAAQAGALLVATIALAFGGWVEVVSWLAMGVGAVVAGRWIGARSLDAYGIVLLCIATVRLATYDLFVGGAGVPWQTTAGVAISPWTLLMLGAGGAWLATAFLMLRTVRDEDSDADDQDATAPRPVVAVVAAALGAAAISAAPAHPESTALAICLVWLVLSLMWRAVASIEARMHLDVFGAVLACGAVIPWLVAAAPGDWIVERSSPGAHPAFWAAGVLTAVLLMHAWAARRRFTWTEFGSPWAVLASAAGLVAFGATSVEVARSAAVLADDETAQRAAISIWWGLWGVSLVIGGFAKRCAPVRYAGLALLAIAATKAVVLDLAGVPPMWRVASFVGLGVLMLGVAVLYGRVSGVIGGVPEDEISPDETDADPVSSMP